MPASLQEGGSGAPRVAFIPPRQREREEMGISSRLAGTCMHGTLSGMLKISELQACRSSNACYSSTSSWRPGGCQSLEYGGRRVDLEGEKQGEEYLYREGYLSIAVLYYCVQSTSTHSILF